MKKEKLILVPLKGIYDTDGKAVVLFGMTAAETEKALGKPSEKVEQESFGDNADDVMTTLYYDDLGLSLSYDKVCDFRLSDIMTDGADTIKCSYGISLGQTIDEVRNIVGKEDLGPMEESDIEDEIAEEESDEGLTAYDVEEQSLTLWFKNDRLDTIQMGPEYDETGENIVWPKK